MNRIILIGRMTKDPELKYTPTGVPMATFGLAVDRITKDAEGKREVDFFNIIAWRQRAEFVAQYASKGMRSAVEGRVQIRSYVGQDGMKRSVTEVVADNVELLESRRDGAGGPAPQSPDAGTAAPVDVDDFADPFSEE